MLFAFIGCSSPLQLQLAYLQPPPQNPPCRVPQMHVPTPGFCPSGIKPQAQKALGMNLKASAQADLELLLARGGEHNTHSSLGRAARAGMRQPAGFASLLAAPLPVAREFAGSLWVRLPLVRLGAVPRRRFLIGFAVGGRQGGRRPARGK